MQRTKTDGIIRFSPFSKLSLNLLQYFTHKRRKQVTLKIEYVTFELPTYFVGSHLIKLFLSSCRQLHGTSKMNKNKLFHDFLEVVSRGDVELICDHITITPKDWEYTSHYCSRRKSNRGNIGVLGPMDSLIS